MGSDVVVIVNGGGAAFTKIDRALVSKRDRVSVAFTVKLNVPSVLGVPEITPVVGFSDKSGGSDPTLTVQARAPVPPVASTCLL